MLPLIAACDWLVFTGVLKAEPIQEPVGNWREFGDVGV